MKRRDLERHLLEHGCELAREGSRHSVWRSPGGLTTVPRHREISPLTARTICDQLGVPRPPR